MPSAQCILAACLIPALGLGIASAQGVPARLKQPRIAPLEEKDWTATERQLLAPIRAERGSVGEPASELAAERSHPEVAV